MKIKVKKVYFNDTTFGKLIPNRDKEETLMLLKIATSYRLSFINEFILKMSVLGYKEVEPLKRKYFKYKISFARIVPFYQRLLVYKDTKVTDKPYKTKTVLISDEIRYTDEDLRLMNNFTKATDITNMPELIGYRERAIIRKESAFYHAGICFENIDNAKAYIDSIIKGKR